MTEREVSNDWNCHRAIVKAAMDRERTVIYHTMQEVEFSLDEILYHLQDYDRWKNVEAVVKEIQFEREYLIRIVGRLLQFYKTIELSLHNSIKYMIECLKDEFVTDTVETNDEK